MKKQILKVTYLLFVSLFLFTSCGEDEIAPNNSNDDQELNDDDNNNEDDDNEPDIEITAEGFDLTIIENPANESVLDTVVASASNESDLNFSISSESVEGAFSINELGEVRVADGSLFDFEANKQMTAEIEVSSGEGSETVQITINLSDYILESDNGLLAYFPLNGNVNDESGNGNDGNESSDLALVSDRFGNENSAMDFSDNQYFWVPNFYDAESAGAQGFTISLWANYDGANPGSYQTFVTKTNSSQVEISYRRRKKASESWADGSQEVYLSGNTSGGTRNAGNSFPVDEWTHIAVVFDPTGSDDSSKGTLTIFENGVEVRAREEVYSQLGNGLITVGNYAGMNAQGTPSGVAQSFSGLLDDLAFFDEALSNDEIAFIYELEEE